MPLAPLPKQVGVLLRERRGYSAFPRFREAVLPLQSHAHRQEVRLVSPGALPWLHSRLVSGEGHAWKSLWGFPVLGACGTRHPAPSGTRDLREDEGSSSLKAPVLEWWRRECL